MLIDLGVVREGCGVCFECDQTGYEAVCQIAAATKPACHDSHVYRDDTMRKRLE